MNEALKHLGCMHRPRLHGGLLFHSSQPTLRKACCTSLRGGADGLMFYRTGKAKKDGPQYTTTPNSDNIIHMHLKSRPTTLKYF